MPSTLPTPVAAALGLVPTVLEKVRRVPAKAVTFPVLALSSALTAMDNARREYDDLAERGERLVARLRGTSFDEIEDRVENRLAGTPVAAGYATAEDVLEDARDTVVKVAEVAREKARRAGSGAARNAAGAAQATGQAVRDAEEAAAGVAKAAGRTAARTAKDRAAADTSAQAGGQQTSAAAPDAPPAEQPKGEPTPKAPEPDHTRIDTAASATVVETVEQVAAAVAPTTAPGHDDLPLADYDHMTLGSLRGRLRSLTVDELVVVRTYEKAHADRLPVVTMLDNRIAKLATDPTATLSPGGNGPAPEQLDATQGGSKISPATAGPSTDPPAHSGPSLPTLPATQGSGA